MISREEILNLAELARLDLSNAEVQSLQKDISGILEYVGQVSSILGDGARIISSTRNVMRTDSPRGAGDLLEGKEESLRTAFPSREGEYNVVRKIIQKDE